MHMRRRRLNGDESAETQALLQQYNVVEVPTFLFFKNGREVTRHVGSSRGDLIGRILQVCSGGGWQAAGQQRAVTPGACGASCPARCVVRCS